MGKGAPARKVAWGAAMLAVTGGILVLERSFVRRASLPIPPSAPEIPRRVSLEPLRTPESLTAEQLLGDWRRGRSVGAPSEAFERLERELETALADLPPAALVQLLIGEGTADVLPLLHRALEGALARDRERTEEVLVGTLEALAEDSARLEGLAEATLERIRDPARRDRAARVLARAAVPARFLVRVLPGLSPQAAAEVRHRLWERAATDDEAAEALGWVVGPDEASRLESLGRRPGVLRGLEIAAERTGEVSFREAVARLRGRSRP